MTTSIAQPLQGFIRQQVENGQAKSEQEVEELIKANLYKIEFDREIEEGIEDIRTGRTELFNDALEDIKKNLLKKYNK